MTRPNCNIQDNIKDKDLRSDDMVIIHYYINAMYNAARAHDRRVYEVRVTRIVL